MTWTPLHEAVVMGDVAALNAALAATIFPDPRDRHGQTPPTSPPIWETLRQCPRCCWPVLPRMHVIAMPRPRFTWQHAQITLGLPDPPRLWPRWPMGAPGRPFTPLGFWMRGNGVTLPPRATLLAAGAEPNAPNCRHETPFGLAYPRALKAFLSA